MASTITRTTWTDDTGTPASPVGDGTTINNARLQEIYAAIDELLAGAAPYDPLVFGGTIQVDGLGTHLFSATGAGANRLRVRAASAGTDNVGGVDVGIDADADLGRLEAYASTFTETGAAKQHGVALREMGAGGVSLAAEHASGDMRLYARGTTKRATFDGDQVALTGGTPGTYRLAGLLAGSMDLTNNGTDANTSEKTLRTYTLPGGTLKTDHQLIRIVVWGTTGQTNNRKRMRVKFGSTIVAEHDSSGSLGNTAVWRVGIAIIRTGAATQQSVVTGRASIRDKRTSPTETLSQDVAITVTGQNYTAVANDLIYEGSWVELWP